MPSRKVENQLIARDKALNTRVYVSGLKGDHTLETGLAYYYRGHYLYSHPGGTLIEPVPYSTKKGISVHGMVSPSAPAYDKSSAGLVAEVSIRALEASIRNELGPRESPPALEDGGEEVDDGPSGGFADLLLGTLSTSLDAPSAAAPLPSPARVSALRQDADSAVRASPVSSLLGPSSSLGIPDVSLLVPLPPSSSIWAPTSSLSAPSLSLSAASSSRSSAPAPSLSVTAAPVSVPAPSLSAPTSSLPVPSSAPSVPAPASSRPIPTLTYTPHAGAAFLAASAPGSRFPSPLPSPSSRGNMSSSQRLSAIRGAPLPMETFPRQHGDPS